MVHLIEAFVLGVVCATVVLVFAGRNNPRVAAWLGIKPAAK